MVAEEGMHKSIVISNDASIAQEMEKRYKGSVTPETEVVTPFKMAAKTRAPSGAFLVNRQPIVHQVRPVLRGHLRSYGPLPSLSLHLSCFSVITSLFGHGAFCEHVWATES
jgi:hypothetical protein